jgi:hypothetical protein
VVASDAGEILASSRGWVADHGVATVISFCRSDEGQGAAAKDRLKSRQDKEAAPAMGNHLTGTIHVGEAYSKAIALQRLGISQRFWDKMLAEGLPFTDVGHSRWITGKHLLEFLELHAETKKSETKAD